MRSTPRFPPPASSNSSDDGGWPAFTDLLGAFVLVIFLGLMFFIINFRQAESQVHTYSKQLDSKEQKLKQREQQLRKLQGEIQSQRNKLKSERDANRRLLADLQQTEQRLRSTMGAKKTLEKMFNKLKIERQQIEEARRKAEAALAKADQQRQKCQSQIAAYIGVRKRIIQRIFTALRKNLDDPKLINFDTKGGSIMLGAKILFRAGRTSLQSQGKHNLQQTWAQIHKVLKHPLNRPYIAGIVLEGYTSSEGDKSLNWQLSTRRSLSALRFLLKHGASYWSQRGLITAAGYGPTRPIRNPDGTENPSASRRIAIRILFRDREQLEQLMQKFGN